MDAHAMTGAGRQPERRGAFDPQPTLTGELVALRPLRPDDHDALYAVARDPELWALHPAKERATPDGFRRLFDESLATGGALLITDPGGGEVLGSSRYHGFDAARDEVEIGWTFLARRCWGGAHNTELKRLMIGHAARFVRTVVFHVHGSNLRSQRAVEKLGAVRDPLPAGTVIAADTRLTYRLPAFDIRVDDLSGPDVAALLAEHLASMHGHSPPGTVHALGLERLRAPDVTFWCVRQRGELVGCGALRQLDARHGELKSMRTAAAHLRRGVAAALLRHMLAEARARGYRRVSLETGSGPAFEPAQALYRRFGFERCPPFADYRDDGFSVCLTLALTTDDSSSHQTGGRP